MAPVVEKLGFEHLLANRLEFAQGRATGRLLPPVLAGETKVEAMRDLCRRYNVEPMSCRAYSDDTSDFPMLEAVGEPVATNPKPGLRRIAVERKWAILDLPRRRP
jgi:phosphoserine phosphatase